MTAIVTQPPTLGSVQFITPRKTFAKSNHCHLFEQFPNQVMREAPFHDFFASQSKKAYNNPKITPLKKQTRKISLEFAKSSQNSHYSWKTMTTRKISYDKQENSIYYASTASETDASSASSELSGFKIVHDGKTIHNEIEEADSPVLNLTGFFAPFDTKFASSELMTGPQANEISLPSFF